MKCATFGILPVSRPEQNVVDDFKKKKIDQSTKINFLNNKNKSVVKGQISSTDLLKVWGWTFASAEVGQGPHSIPGHCETS